MIVNLDRTSWSPNLSSLNPSMVMHPPADSMILNNPRAKDDFPAPVLPTKPT